MMRRLLALPFAALLVVGVVHAKEADNVHASHAWIRVLPGDLPAGAYVTLSNHGDKAVALTGASSPAYAGVMLHQSTIRNGMSHMSMVDKITVPAHGQAVLAPGGYHLMLMHAVHPVKPGDTVKVMLRFADGSTLDSSFLARPANATGN